MSKLKETLKKIPGLRSAFHACRDFAQDMQSLPAFLQERRICRKGPIKVGFLCQYLPAWTKVESIYQQMKADDRFEPYILCIPSGIRDSELIDPEDTANDTYAFMLSKGYDEAVNTLTGRNTWLDLEPMGFSYIFYPRPYNALIPRCYGSKAVSRYARVCILMYGINTTEDITRITLNRDFMGHAYYYFAEVSFARQKNIQNNRLLHGLGLQKSVCLGVPVLENLARERNSVSPSWEFSRNGFRVMWTPRWTTAESEGGSNFFTYQHSMLQFARENPDMDFLFRPHPLMFSHFLESGEMTADQVREFKACCESLPNVSLDRQSQYEATLWGSSVLVSDISGLIPEYFTTGKPLIFCASNMHLRLADFAQRMMEGCYVVNNGEELFSCLRRLKAGEDPLREKRLALSRELFGDSGEGATGRILEELAKDRMK